MTPHDKMFAHIKESERRRMREHYDSPARKFTNGGEDVDAGASSTVAMAPHVNIHVTLLLTALSCHCSSCLPASKPRSR